MKARALALEDGQLVSLLQVNQVFSIVEFERRSTRRGRSFSVFVSRANFLGVAVLAGMGFNRLAYGRGNERVTTAEDLYPTAKGVVRGIKKALEDFPDILDQYPFLRDEIKDPTKPQDPDKKIELSAKLFNPAPFMTTSANIGGGTVGDLERSAYTPSIPKVMP